MDRVNIKETTKHHAREIALKERKKKSKDQRQRRKDRKKDGKPAGIPHTLETLRTPDETILPKDDVDVVQEEEQDEFARIFANEIEPKLLLTHSDRVSPKTVGFCKELSKVIPNVTLAPRWHLPLKKLIPKAIIHGFTALLVLNEDMKEMNTLVVSHLPAGPTATFRLSNVMPRRKIKGLKHKGIEPGVTPHLILARFMTRVGRRCERILGALFPSVSRGPPQPHCRTVVFHNQRDYIFFRHFRYQHRRNRMGGEGNDVEDMSGEQEPNDRVAINEVGPRFTLKLKSIQKGTFDTLFGDYEWVKKRAVLGKSRRTFCL